jgi:hypothetical protein
MMGSWPRFEARAQELAQAKHPVPGADTLVWSGWLTRSKPRRSHR